MLISMCFGEWLIIEEFNIVKSMKDFKHGEKYRNFT